MSGMRKTTLDRTERARILIVDDDANVRFLLTLEISKRGHEVVEAADGVQAIEEMSRGNFDIVLTDIGMPGMDGLELAAWIKRTRPDTDVIVMTSYASIESAATAVRLGAFDYLLKNFGVMDLVTSSIDRAIQKRTLQSKLKENLEGLRKSEERFRLLVERTTDGIIVVGQAEDDTAEFIRARELLTDADRIVFLGFGYHPESVRRLGVFDSPWNDEDRARTEVVGTMQGISTGGRTIIRDQVLNGAMPAPSAATVFAFLNEEYWLDR